ncbi:MAG TPA: hypothetical protein VIG77_11015 [Ktedonobacterales bacterium]|jgi:hypothetical protein
MAEDDVGPGGDTLQLIEISILLPCGISGCAQVTHRARIERAPESAALYLLLPLCDLHLRRLGAPADAPASASDGPAHGVADGIADGAADPSDSVGPVAAR